MQIFSFSNLVVIGLIAYGVYRFVITNPKDVKKTKKKKSKGKKSKNKDISPDTPPNHPETPANASNELEEPPSNSPIPPNQPLSESFTEFSDDGWNVVQKSSKSKTLVIKATTSQPSTISKRPAKHQQHEELTAMQKKNQRKKEKERELKAIQAQQQEERLRAYRKSQLESHVSQLAKQDLEKERKRLLAKNTPESSKKTSSFDANSIWE